VLGKLNLSTHLTFADRGVSRNNARGSRDHVVAVHRSFRSTQSHLRMDSGLFNTNRSTHTVQSLKSTCFQTHLFLRFKASSGPANSGSRPARRPMAGGMRHLDHGSPMFVQWFESGSTVSLHCNVAVTSTFFIFSVLHAERHDPFSIRSQVATESKVVNLFSFKNGTG
jgi:hypothetical protein